VSPRAPQAPPRWLTLGLLGLVLGLSGAVLAKPQPLVKGPAQSPTTMQDWVRHPHSEKYYQESWTTILRSQEGLILYLNFIYTNLGVFSGSTAVNASLALPGKTAKFYRYDYKTKDFSQDAATGRIQIARSSMTLANGKDVTIAVAEKGFGLDLRLTGWMPGVKHHTGRLCLRDGCKELVDHYVHVPRASVQGTLTLGGQTIPITGDAYLDHMVQNVLGTDYSTRWYTMRYFAPGHTVAFLVWDSPEDLGRERIIRYFATDREKILTFGTQFELKTDAARKDPKGHTYDTRFVFSAPPTASGWSFSGEARGGRLHDRDALTERLSWAERQVVGLVAGNPVFYRLEGKAQVTLGGPGGQTVPLDGTCLMESVVLGGE